MKTILQGILIFGIGGCIAWYVIANEEKKTITKDYNKQYRDTPLYYKRYIKTSVVYLNKHKK